MKTGKIIKGLEAIISRYDDEAWEDDEIYITNYHEIPLTDKDAKVLRAAVKQLKDVRKKETTKA